MTASSPTTALTTRRNLPLSPISAESEVELQPEIAAYIAHLEAEAQLLAETRQILWESVEWPQSTRIYALGIHLEPGAVGERSGQKQLAMSQEHVAQRLGLGESSVKNAEKQLSSVGIIKRDSQRIAYDLATGRTLDKRELQGRPRDTYGYITEAKLLENPLPPSLPRVLADTSYTERQRDKEKAKREEAATNATRVVELQAQLAALTCPSCGTAHSLAVVCTCCGERLPAPTQEVELQPSTFDGDLALEVELQPSAFDDSLVFGVPPKTPDTQVELQPSVFDGDPTQEVELQPSAFDSDLSHEVELQPAPSEARTRRPPPASAEAEVEIQPPRLYTGQNSTSKLGDEVDQANVGGFAAPGLAPVPWDEAMLKRWVARRIGDSRDLTTQNSHSGDSGKAKYLPLQVVGSRYDLDRYLAGEPGHLYGSRPGLADGRAWLLSYDLDAKFGATSAEVLAMQQQLLTRTGLRSASFKRKPGSYRFELHFDAPVGVLAAHQLVLAAVPQLANFSDECYPAAPGGQWKDCSKRNYGWPFWWLDEQDRPHESPVTFVSEWGQLQAAGVASDLATILAGLAQCQNSAALIPAGDVRPLAPAAVPEGGAVRASIRVSTPSTGARRGSGEAADLIKSALAWWMETHDEREVLRDVEIDERGYFSSPLRDDDDGPSMRAIPGRPGLYHDHGARITVDLFDLHCVLVGLDKRTEVWRVVDQYLISKGKEPRYSDLASGRERKTAGPAWVVEL